MRPTSVNISVNFSDDLGAVAVASIDGLVVTWQGSPIAYSTSGNTISLSPTVGAYYDSYTLYVSGSYNGRRVYKSFNLWGVDTTLGISFGTDPVLNFQYAPHANVARAQDGSYGATRSWNVPNVGSSWQIEFGVLKDGIITLTKDSNTVSLQYEAQKYYPSHAITVNTSFNDGETELMDLAHTAETSIDLSGLHTFDMNGIPQYPTGRVAMTANLYDNTGSLLASDTYDETIEVASYGGWTPATWLFNISPIPAGAYYVEYEYKAMLEDSSAGPNYKTVLRNPYSVVHWLNIYKDDSGKLVMENFGISSATVTLYTLSGTKEEPSFELDIDNVYVIPSGSNVVIDKQGVWKAVATGDTDHEFVVVNFQDLSNCIENLILMAMEGKDTQKILRIAPQMFYYMSLLNSEYVANYFYEIGGIDETKLKEMWEIDEVMKIIDALCESCFDPNLDCKC